MIAYFVSQDAAGLPSVLPCSVLPSLASTWLVYAFVAKCAASSTTYCLFLTFHSLGCSSSCFSYYVTSTNCWVSVSAVACLSNYCTTNCQFPSGRRKSYNLPMSPHNVCSSILSLVLSPISPQLYCFTFMSPDFPAV